MKLEALQKIRHRDPIDVAVDVAGDRRSSIAENVGSVVLWFGGIFGSMWLARWYTIRTLRKKGVPGV